MKNNNNNDKDKRYLKIDGATDADIDDFIDSLFNKHWINPTKVIRQTLSANHVNPSRIVSLWHQKVKTDDREGVLGIVKLDSGEYMAITNTPVMPLTREGFTLQPEAISAFLKFEPEVHPDRITVNSGYFNFCNISELRVLDEENLAQEFLRLRNDLQKIKNALIIAFHRYFGADEEEIRKIMLVPVLPDINLSEGDAERLHRILLLADQRARDNFNLMMEKWAALGYVVSTTPQSIVLDAPFGKHGAKVRIAILLPGESKNVADYFGEDHHEIQPSIILPWESLQDDPGITDDTFRTYQERVESTVDLRMTERSAHVKEVLSLDLEAVGELVDALVDLVQSIDHDEVKSKVKGGRVTPKNIKATLVNCNTQTWKIFERLIQAWRSAGGSVQCTKPGRIYLKMKSRAHNEGEISRKAHRFNLMTLICSKEEKQAAIQVAWSLADAEKPSAYLDGIPGAVDSFEKAVSRMPGFEQRGAITRLVVDESFTEQHLDQLVWAILALKAAEEAAL